MNTQYQLNFLKEDLKKQIIPGQGAPMSKLDTRKKTSALAYHPKKH